MGRKPDPTHPARAARAKRGNATERALEHGRQLAAQFAAEAAGADPLAVPFLLDDRLPFAAKVWEVYAPMLARVHLLRGPYRSMFVGFCVFYAQFVHATDMLAENGHVVRIKGTNGSYRQRVSPWVELQRAAWSEVMGLAQEFGVTPAAGYKLLRDQKALLGGTQGDLWGDGAPRAASETEPRKPAAPAPASAADMTMFDSAPPDGRPN